ncbi:DegV family protein [Fusibacter ferrireducens]|uniref:DegV family protein n=1 Tax=Fusibacter ferrireducens TaxID=2785058 RepID=A0ABR9ZUW5_9FIRM|nr:DegV family protein [Fusibacter ferrireducens]MBF4694146.1 DegV family protein [Fusibacter ferrireducens]
MPITLVTDSTCDLTPKELADQGILFASLKVLFKDAEYIDKINLDTATFYEKMRNSPELPTTSQVNPNEFYDIFSAEIEKGNAVLGIFISSELSGTYNSAKIAKEMIGSDQIYLVDSRTTSFSLALILLKANQWIKEGKSIDRIQRDLNVLVEKAQLYGMLDSLDNLKKGGRLSSGTAMIGKMLNLKPIIEVKNGVVEMANKVRGTRKGMSWMIEQLKNEYPEGIIDTLALAHANDLKKLEELKALINASFDVHNIYEVEIGSVVGTHTGEGVVGVAYFRK